MKQSTVFIIMFLTFSCSNPETKKAQKDRQMNLPTLTIEEANRLIQLPLNCINTEYPNKLNQTIGSEKDLQSPKSLHPAFYGCFDWHSSVHGHWSLVSLLKHFPTVEGAQDARVRLQMSLSKANILVETAYFKKVVNAGYERTYGWAWLLKLAEELHTWKDPLARELEANLAPLTSLISQNFIDFLPKLKYPIRVGEHTNTAFGLSFAWDYAHSLGNSVLLDAINKRAKDFYLADQQCPLSWEPSGYDFLSPCLEEAALMKRVLPKAQFKVWLAAFLPQLSNQSFHFPAGEVSDRTDGKLVHLDGLNFSRAWTLNTIIAGLPSYEHLKETEKKSINHSLPNVVGDHYEGGHWLGSFAIYALNSFQHD